jgi:hypothetical protein
MGYLINSFWYILIGNFSVFFVVCLFSFFETKIALEIFLFLYLPLGNFSYWPVEFSSHLKQISDQNVSGKIIRISFLYGGFVFISSLIREAPKT